MTKQTRARATLAWKWLLRAGGFAGVGYETLSGKPVDPTLLFVYAAMMGLPQLLASSIESPSREERDREDDHDNAP